MPPISDSRHSNQRVAPSFAKCSAATTKSSRIKQRNRKTNPKAEVALRRALWERGLRYRLHAKDLPGTPDIVFRALKLVVFVDGDFWHGRDWEMRKEKLSRGANSSYWISKIAYNRERDRENDAKLTQMDWLVVRFWETDIRRNLVAFVDQIERLVALRKACI